MDNWTGYLRMVCTKKDERSIIQDSYFEGAFKITRPVYLEHNGQAYLYVMNPGGGYLDGDSYRMEVHLHPEAEVLLTTQSSTKIYKTLTYPVFQETEIVLKNRSLLEYLPDPIIAYEQARFMQQTVIQMESGASLVYAELFTPGWAPDGSWFRYDLLQSRMKVYMDGKLILFDHLKLEPDQDIRGLGQMEGYTHYGSMIVINEDIDSPFIDRLTQMLQPFSEAAVGLSMLTVPGFTLRVLAHRTQDVEKLFHLCHGLFRECNLGKNALFLRKY
ncbi:urease accessory protein UreD [Aneurinibacillus sp. Ricciae_BoGa-3]|uniref:urease accessory protein UreD n=1 Tax=Aneurinibacillus sp. Ricciae_BoGa-3 TaxID=3022697 RepID=UPI002341A2B4|nr:urease accessory protein UreD [Aneurinibacillus sp. Ricciae_BoGa-3]WCK53798.1 urease accessory protein UreD [Aneurinibacillus sp. Ricciae_BoGa-3]